MDEKAALQAQVETLQLKLHQLHATDVNTFRRSYATISQHVEALKVEASRLEALIHEVEPDIYTPEFVAEEFGKAAVVGGAGWVLYKVVKSIPPIPAKAKSWLAGGLFVATAAVISWRFASSSIGRFASAFFDHRRRKKAFLKELSELQHRIDILLAITASLPHALSQPNLPALAAPEPAAASTAASRNGSGGSGTREQFVVVDLPRVESGGFVMPSPAPSPPPAVLGVSGLPPVPPSAAAASSSKVASSAADAGGAGSDGGWSVGVRRQLPPQTAVEAGGPFAAVAAQQQQGHHPGVTAAAAVAGPAGKEAAAAGQAAQGPGDTAAAGVQEGAAAGDERGQEGGRQSADAQQWQEALQGAQAATSSSAGYEIPDSVMKAGWGGVTQQQPWQPHLYPPAPEQQQQQQGSSGVAGVQQQQQEQQQQQLQRVASPAVRQWSSGVLGEEGEFVEQPSDPEDQSAAGASSSRRPAGSTVAAGGSGVGEQRGGALQRGSPASSSSDDAVLLERE